MKTCSKCKIEKSNCDFHANPVMKDNLHTWCKACQLSANNIRRRLKMTGCTEEMYNNMFVEQAGCCKICGKHQSAQKKSLSVDHCHETLEIRGLLCDNCNLGLGRFKDNPVLLNKAIKYLRS